MEPKISTPLKLNLVIKYSPESVSCNSHPRNQFPKNVTLQNPLISSLVSQMAGFQYVFHFLSPLL
jgi:hypothetical protein